MSSDSTGQPGPGEPAGTDPYTPPAEPAAGTDQPTGGEAPAAYPTAPVYPAAGGAPASGGAPSSGGTPSYGSTPGYGDTSYGSTASYGGAASSPGATYPGAPGGYPAGGGYPPSTGYPGPEQGYPPPYGATPYGPTPYGAQPPRSTDGVSIAALVTGILGLGPIPLILGIVGVRRTRANGTNGRGMSIAGIVLGVLSILAWTAVVVLAVVGLGALGSAYQEKVDELHASCAAGDMADCDTLAAFAASGSAEEEFGETCGGRTDGSTPCSLVGLPGTDGGSEPEGEDLGGDGLSGDAYGSDPVLDGLWDACAAGDFQACDDLYDSSAPGSEYEEFGETCGGRVETMEYCVDAMAG